MTLVDDSLGVEIGGRWRLQHFRDLLEFCACIQRAWPGDDDRISGRAQNAGCLLERVRIRFGGRVRRRRLKQRDFAIALHHVRRHFQRHRQGSSGMQLPKRLGHHCRRIGGARYPLGPLRETLEDAELIVNLVQHAPALVDVLRGDLPGQAEHARVGGVGCYQGGSRVENARAGHHAEHAGPPGGGCVSQRHVRRALLMARVDDFNRTLILREGVKEPVCLTAGQPEHGIDAMRQHRAHQRLPTRHSLSLHASP